MFVLYMYVCYIYVTYDVCAYVFDDSSKIDAFVHMEIYTSMFDVVACDQKKEKRIDYCANLNFGTKK